MPKSIQKRQRGAIGPPNVNKSIQNVNLKIDIKIRHPLGDPRKDALATKIVSGATKGSRCTPKRGRRPGVPQKAGPASDLVLVHDLIPLLRSVWFNRKPYLYRPCSITWSSW